MTCWKLCEIIDENTCAFSDIKKSISSVWWAPDYNVDDGSQPSWRPVIRRSHEPPGHQARGEPADHGGGGGHAPVPGLRLHLPHGLPRGRGLPLLPVPALAPPRQCKTHVRHLRRPRQWQTLWGLLLRGLQGNLSPVIVIIVMIKSLFLGILQKNSEKGADLCMSWEQKLSDWQETEEPVSVLSLQQVSRLWHEERGRAGGAAAR